jgi:ribosomal protein S18 acetylase RimI-like enzyme
LRERAPESALFGLEIFSADVATPDEVQQATTMFNTRGGTLLIMRLPARAIDAAQAAELAGAYLCDALLTMTRRVGPGEVVGESAADTARVRRGASTDAPALYALGESAFVGFMGHWHADRRLATQHADALYARWARDLAANTGAQTPLWVTEQTDGGLLGFLALREVAPAHWDVPLTAVAPLARGRGLLGQMLAHAVHETCAASGARIDYETQLANSSALRAVGRAGFVPSSARLTYHLWSPHRAA